MVEIKGGPLDWSNGDARSESNAIFTATVLGFALARAVQGQPFSFDVAHDAKFEEFAEMKAVAEAIVRLVQSSPALGPGRAGQALSAGRSPAHNRKKDNVITGCPGGEFLTPEQRNRPIREASAIAMADWEYASAEPGGEEFEGQYHNRGAYTGLIDDPVGNHTLIVPTQRRVITDPERWTPVPDDIWGLIGANNQGGKSGSNLSPDPAIGMGPIKVERGIVQYTHGMCSAMREAERWGPWCTPYEIAVGKHTTKRASCFACTTYNWASGYPPSSTHLGRCESWAPLPDGSSGKSEDYDFSDDWEGELDRAIGRQMNIRWNIQMYHFLRQGSHLLQINPTAIDRGHIGAADLLARRYDRWNPELALKGGNLFLDAITYHETDTKRISAMLSPLLR